MGLTKEELQLLLESFNSDRSGGNEQKEKVNLENVDTSEVSSVSDLNKHTQAVTDLNVLLSDVDSELINDSDHISTDNYEFNEPQKEKTNHSVKNYFQLSTAKENKNDSADVQHLQKNENADFSPFGSNSFLTLSDKITQSPTKIPPNTKLFSTQSLETSPFKKKNKEGNSGKQNFQLLENINIYVNGYTDPGRLQLHRLMTMYGGKFTERLTSKKAVSHIIATNLTPKKRIEFAKYKVVRPQWITESIKAQKVLNWQEYSLFYETKTNITKKFAKAGSGNSADPPPMHTIDCNHPDFLASFYSKSRLHFLSTTKMLLQSKYLKYTSPPLASTPNAVSSSLRQKLTSKTDSTPLKTIYYIDFDCFFAKVSSLMDPSVDIDKDCIVVSHGQNTADIASCNYVARQKFGIYNGEWVSSAKLKCKNDLKILPYHFAKYKEISEYLQLYLKNKFDCIIPLSCDECIAYDYGELDYEKSRIKCENIREGVEKITKCTISIGVSTTLYVSKLALKYAKPDGYKIVDPERDNVSEFVSLFDLTDLPGIGYNIVEKINHLASSYKKDQSTKGTKIFTIADLIEFIETQRQRYQLSFRQVTIQILSSIGEKLLKKFINYLADCKDDSESLQKLDQPLKYFERKSISVDINYGVRFQNIDQVYKFLERICNYLLTQLQEISMCTNQLVLKLAKRLPGEPIEPSKHMGMGKCEFMSKLKNLRKYTNEKFIILPELKSLFHQLYKAYAISDIRGISVQFMRLSKTDAAIPKTSLLDFGMFKLKKLTDNDALVMHNAKTPTTKDKKCASEPAALPVTPQFDSSKRSTSPVKDFFDNYSKKKRKLSIPDHIDMSVLRELPVNLQRELLAEYHLINTINTSKAKRILEKSTGKLSSSLKKSHSSETIYMQNNDYETANSSKERLPRKRITFQTKQRPKEIRQLLQAWVQYSIEIGPLDEDKALFLKFCQKLLTQRKFSNIILYITFLQNLVDYYRDRSSQGSEPSEGVDAWSRYLLLQLQPLLSQCDNL
ncbi:hypothetical protein ACO0QE_003252 [Hanseniaspora vineae]